MPQIIEKPCTLEERDPCVTVLSRNQVQDVLAMIRYDLSLDRSRTARQVGDRLSRYGDQWRIFLRTTKNNAPVHLPVPDVMVEAINAVPRPRKAGKICPWVFWNGHSKPKSQISEVSETLAAVFRESGVPDAEAHRFRHTLATELLGEGASFEEVADILGNSPEIVRKHYAKWSAKRQGRVDKLMKKVHKNSWKRDS